jgi:PII-like signaling protein
MLASDKTIPVGVQRGNHELVVPQRMKYGTMKMAIPSIPLPNKRRSVDHTYSTNGNSIIQFRFPKTHFHDFRKGFVSFDLAIGTGGGTYKRLSQGIWSIVDRMKIFVGEEEFEDIQKYNILHTYLNESGANSDASATMLRGSSGVGTQVERNALGAVTTSYHLPLVSGVLNMGVWPLKLMKDVLRIELHLGNPQEYVETDWVGTAPVITITNPKFHNEKVSYLQSMENKISRELDRGMNLSYTTFTHYLSNSSGATEQNIQIPHIADLNDALHVLFQTAATTSDTTTNDKFLTWPKAGFSSVQYEINNTNRPEEPIDGQDDNANEAYQQYLKYYGFWPLSGMSQKEPPIDVNAYNSSRFFVIEDLRSAPNEPLVSSTTFSDANSDTLMKMKWTAPFVGYNIHSYVEHKKLGVLHRSASRSGRKLA